MPYRATCLEDSLDAWGAQEPDDDRRRTVVEWLMALCEARGRLDGVPVAGMTLPTFVANVSPADVLVVWVVVDRFEEVAVRRLYDRHTGRWFGV